MYRVILPFVAALLFFLSGSFILNLQIWYSNKSEYVAAAQYALKNIDQILEEASQATQTGLAVARAQCSLEEQYRLATVATLKPHLRTILLLKEGKIWCTSLPGNRLLLTNVTDLPDSPLFLTASGQNIHDTASMVYQTRTADVTILVTVSDSQLRTALFTSQQNVDPQLVIGPNALGLRGDVRTFHPGGTDTAFISSAAYPFGIQYQLPPLFSLTRIFHQGGGMLLFIFFISCIGFWLLRKYSGNVATPADALRQAIILGEIVPYYQPVVDGRDNSIRGIEVLARWKHPTAGFISPATFIPLAEKTGLIIPLTQSLMRQVVEHMNLISTKLPEGFHIGINVSAAHINSPGFVEDCLKYQSGFIHQHLTLVLEVTEREPLSVDEQLLNKLNSLHTHHFAIALDDFGTGYSGLSYLHDLKIDYIKIDQSFVGRVNDDEDSTKLLDCVLELARKLSLIIVAEGVETRTQLDYLNRNHITLLQGYYFYKPVKFVELVKILLTKPKARIERYMEP